MRTLSLIIILITSSIYLNAQEEYDAEYFGDLGEFEGCRKLTTDSLSIISPYEGTTLLSPNYNKAIIFISQFKNYPQVIDIIFIGNDTLVRIKYLFTDVLNSYVFNQTNIDLYAAVVVDASMDIWKSDNRGTTMEFVATNNYDTMQSITVWRLVHRYKYKFENFVEQDVFANNIDELNAEIDIAIALARIQISCKKNIIKNKI